MRFQIVDVFTRDGVGGNQLAVVLCEPGRLETGRMQAIAREFNFSETTFLSPEPDAQGAYPTRVFTPVSEMPFAGHPTLGTAWVIRQFLSPGADELTLAMGIGGVRVRFEGPRPFLTAPPTESAPLDDPRALLGAWGVDPGLLDTRFPAARLSAGYALSLIPLVSREALEAVKVRQDQPGLFVLLAPSPSSDSLCMRVFAPLEGIAEDPATGGAAVCVARYVLDTDYLAQGARFGTSIAQGDCVGRPSRLFLRAERQDEGDAIQVGGDVGAFASGELTGA